MVFKDVNDMMLYDVFIERFLGKRNLKIIYLDCMI